MEGKDTELLTADGFPLAATEWIPASPRAAVLVAPAMGVPRAFYAAFAADLALSGLSVLCFDYRGIGGSRTGPLRGFAASLHDWGELDLAAGIARLAGTGLPLGLVAHSVGGQVFGLAPAAPVKAALFVGSQSGHYRHWDGVGRLLIAALWYAVIPALVPAVGYLPMRVLGQGEDVPAGVALEWARWGRERDYVMSYARTRGETSFDTWPGALRLLAVEDDPYAPFRGVAALASFYRSARAEVRTVRPSELGVRRVGHFGFFRPAFKDTLWRDARAFLLGRLL